MLEGLVQLLQCPNDTRNAFVSAHDISDRGSRSREPVASRPNRITREEREPICPLRVSFHDVTSRGVRPIDSMADATTLSNGRTRRSVPSPNRPAAHLDPRRPGRKPCPDRDPASIETRRRGRSSRAADIYILNCGNRYPNKGPVIQDIKLRRHILWRYDPV